MTDTDIPATSTGRLEKAGDYVRAAAHADPPVTPPEVYDQIGALHGLTQKIEQHLTRCAAALMKAAEDPALIATDDDPDPAFTARTAMFRLQGTARERLAGLVAELNTTWSQVSALTLAEPAAELEPEKPAADWPEDDNGRLPVEKE